jgi:ectoine hydroxylase-related dioxygenase (phytanoyl-CoA dioxygenase family)
MRQVFSDLKLEEEFQEMGYIKVPFLSDAEVVLLKQAYEDTLAHSKGRLQPEEADYKSSGEITYDFTFIDRNTDYKREVFDIITPVFQKHADRYLKDYRPIIANFISKRHQGGEVPLHQNWAFVDEHKYTSISIWCPLVDTSKQNGTLEIVNRSHKRFGELRGPMVPWEIDPLTEEIIENHLTPMNAKAGEAVILDDSILHYSKINDKESNRLAIQLIMKPQEATSIHHHLDADSDPHHVQILKVDDEFFIGFHPWRKPRGQEVIDTVPFQLRKLDSKEFINILMGPRFDQNAQIIRNAVHVPRKAENIDNRSFFQIYTPKNILAEIRYRLSGKAESGSR